jgi:hypothetical protein
MSHIQSALTLFAVTPFDPYGASDELRAASNDTRRALAAEFWRDEPILSDAETREEIQRCWHSASWLNRRNHQLVYIEV